MARPTRLERVPFRSARRSAGRRSHEKTVGCGLGASPGSGRTARLGPRSAQSPPTQVVAGLRLPRVDPSCTPSRQRGPCGSGHSGVLDWQPETENVIHRGPFGAPIACEPRPRSPSRSFRPSPPEPAGPPRFPPPGRSRRQCVSQHWPDLARSSFAAQDNVRRVGQRSDAHPHPTPPPNYSPSQGFLPRSHPLLFPRAPHFSTSACV